MILDFENQFSNNQSMVSGIGTVVATNSVGINRVQPTKNGNPGVADSGKTDMKYQANFSNLVGVGASINIQLITSANENMSSPAVVAESGVRTVAQIVAGQFVIPVPDELDLNPTHIWLGMQYVISGAGVTAGTVTSSRVGAKQRWG